jgi:hypothetical protein
MTPTACMLSFAKDSVPMDFLEKYAAYSASRNKPTVVKRKLNMLAG